MPHNEWLTKPLDGKYLVDSGLLDEINLRTLNLFGIGLTVDANGSIILSDNRKEPEKALMDKPSISAWKEKLSKFLSEFGHKQMDIRTHKLGRSVQA